MAIKEIQKNNKQKDNLLNIQTDYKIEPDKIDYHRTESTDYYVLDVLFAHLVTNKDDVLVDMGAGTGRVLIYSAHHLSIRVKGIEYQKSAYQIAQKNSQYYQKQYGQSAIELYQMTVEDYQIKTEDTIFYFFNPFSWTIMRTVLYHIMQSIQQYNRSVQLVLYYPLDESIYFIEERTPFKLKQSIILSGYHKDRRERILIYKNENNA